MAYTSIVVGTDGSATATRAVEHAAGVAAADGARLVVVSAYSPGSHRPDPTDSAEVPDELRYLLSDRVQAEELTESARAVAREAGVAKVVVQALPGDPGHVLLETATEFAADLIVVGSRGLTSHAHFLLGSVASTVAHHAPCDVLVAHTTG